MMKIEEISNLPQNNWGKYQLKATDPAYGWPVWIGRQNNCTRDEQGAI